VLTCRKCVNTVVLHLSFKIHISRDVSDGGRVTFKIFTTEVTWIQGKRSFSLATRNNSIQSIIASTGVYITFFPYRMVINTAGLT
jgi:hypothetical protein